MRFVADLIARVLRHPGDERVREEVRGSVAELTRRFPLYPELWKAIGGETPPHARGTA